MAQSGLLRWLTADIDPAASFFRRLPEVETERLLLRPLRLRDAADIYAYAQDPRVARYVLWDAHTGVGDSRDYIRWNRQQYRAGLPGSWAMVLRETGRVIGTIGYMSWDGEQSCAELGYSLGREWWNRGLATEALRTVIDISFRSFPVHRLEAMHETENPASGRVMEKCGMRREGVLRGKIANKGAWRDVVLWAMLREDWERGVSPR